MGAGWEEGSCRDDEEEEEVEEEDDDDEEEGRDGLCVGIAAVAGVDGWGCCCGCR